MISPIGSGVGSTWLKEKDPFNNKISMIISDHYPFLKRKIPALILIDIEYPQWHTHSDTIEYCSRESLKYIGDVLFTYLVNEKKNI